MSELAKRIAGPTCAMVLAAGLGGRHGDLAVLVLVAAPEGGLAASVTAVLPPPGGGEGLLPRSR